MYNLTITCDENRPKRNLVRGTFKKLLTEAFPEKTRLF